MEYFMDNNLYDLLGISKNATVDEINKAFRKQALKYHPDKTGHLSDNDKELANEKFKKINDARDTLINPILRQEYDASMAVPLQKYNGTTTTTPSNSFEERIATFDRTANPDSYTRVSGFGEEFHNETNNFKLSYRTSIKKSYRTIFPNNTYYDSPNCHTGSYPIYYVSLDLNKNNLEPMQNQLKKLVAGLYTKSLNSTQVINPKYTKMALKIITMSEDITAKIDTLLILTNQRNQHYINFQDMLDTLQEIKRIITNIQSDDDIANHRGFVRDCPILRELLVCLDLIANFFPFLAKKINKAVSGDKTPVFANMQEFKYGMFKPAQTSTLRKVDEIKATVTWYIEAIEKRHDTDKQEAWNLYKQNAGTTT